MCHAKSRYLFQGFLIRTVYAFNSQDPKESFPVFGIRMTLALRLELAAAKWSPPQRVPHTSPHSSHYMQPLVKRWLQKCHWLTNLKPRPRVCKYAREHLEPAVIPTRYICEELVSEYASYWTRVQDDDGEVLQEIQLSALTRWRTFKFELGKSTEAHPLPLDFFVQIFDDYFFLGALGPYIEVKMADDTPANSGWVGITKKKRHFTSSAPPEIQIELKRQPHQLWTRTRIQESLDTLLHEMTHAFLMIYSAPEAFLEYFRYRRLVETEGLTGHGPCWVRVAAAVAAEADRSLGGMWEMWSLGITNALLSEKAALVELYDRKELETMEEELE